MENSAHPCVMHWRSPTRLACGQETTCRIDVQVLTTLPHNSEFIFYTSNTYGWHDLLWRLNQAWIETAAGLDLRAEIFHAECGDWRPTSPGMIHVLNRGGPIPAGETFSLCFTGIAPLSVWPAACWGGDCFLYEFRPGRATVFSTEIPDAAEALRHIGEAAVAIMPRVEYVAAEPYELKLLAREVGKGEFELVAKMEDPYGNVAVTTSGECTCALSGHPDLKMTLDKGVSKHFRIHATAKVPSSVAVRAADWHVRKNRPQPVGIFDPEWSIYFGDIHGHTREFSDGMFSGDDYYTYARDVSNLSICAMSDHYHPHGHAKDFWPRTLDLNDKYYEPGRFVTLHGFEWDCRKYKHHKNVYFPTREMAESLAPGTPDNTEDFFEYYRDKDVIIVPHHPNISSGLSCAWQQHHWTHHDERTERLVEIYQMRGSSEAEAGDDSWSHYAHGASVRHALGLGYRMGFIGGTDTHRSEPAAAFLPHPIFIPAGERTIPGRYKDFFGLGAFVCRELTRETVFEAMRQRRTFATTGDRIFLGFGLNQAIMGEEIPAGPEVCMKIKVWGTDSVDSLQLIRNGACIMEWHALPAVTELEWVDAENTATCSSYYYFRLRQSNGQMAWASPIWVG